MEIILASYLFSHYFVNIANIPNWIKNVYDMPIHKRIKPLDCVVCLSVWVAAILYFVPNEVTHFILIIFAAGVLSSIDIISHICRILFKIGDPYK
jgi:hypothetical protein